MEEEQQASQNFIGSRETLTMILFLLIILMAGYFRFTGLDWDQNYHLHPDERFLTIVGSALQGAPDPITYLSTSTSPLNPYNIGQTFFVYGNFPMSATRYLAEWYNNVCSLFPNVQADAPMGCSYNYTAYDGIHIFGRFLSGLMDMFSIVFLFLLGRRLYNNWVGLMAALLLTMAVMPIQQSHFFTMDNWAAALTTFTIYTAVRITQFGEPSIKWQWRWWVLFGVGLGLAVASRINVAPLALIVNVAAVIWLLRRGHTWQSISADLSDTVQGRPAAHLSPSGHLPSADIQRMITGIALAAIVSFFTFRVAMPYAFADAEVVRSSVLETTGQEPNFLTVAIQSVVGFNPQWRDNMSAIQDQQGPEFAAPFALQWTDRTPIVFPLTNMISYGMGITAGLMAWFATLWALWRIVKARPDWMRHAIPVSWSLLYFLFMGTRWVTSTRYFLPIYPTMLLLAAWGLWRVLENAKGSGGLRPLKTTAASALIIAVVLPSFLWATAYMDTYTQPMTRIAASEWMYDNIPSGATLIYEPVGTNGEQKQFQLPLQIYDFGTNGNPLNLNFNMPEDGTVVGLRFSYAMQFEPSSVTFDLSYNNGSEIHDSSLQAELNTERQPIQFDLPPTLVRENAPQSISVQLVQGNPVRIDTSHLFTEHWDDGIPLGIGGRNTWGSYYRSTSGDQLPVTGLDSPQKREELIGWLDESDYIILSSQRALWSLPRIPISFPMMITFYENLFAEEIGFELVADFHADYHAGPLYFSDTTGQIGWGEPPTVGWPPPSDLAAEEAFSIYDHPPVWVFKKTDNYDRTKVVELLGTLDLSPDKVVFMNPGAATAARNGLLLTNEAQEQYRENGTFSEIFAVDSVLNSNPTLAAAVWWLAVVALGWLAFPLSAVLFTGLPDKGFAFSRIMALLLVSYFGWAMASLNLLPNQRSTYLLGVGLVAVLSVISLIKRRGELATFLRQNVRYVVIVELFALTLFLFFIFIRVGNPDLWHIVWGGEKPMDLTYFTAVLKSTQFPPYDPWYAGGYLNYYYYGFVYVGSLTHLLGIVPAISYNLSVIMIFSFTGLSAFGIAYNLLAWGSGIRDRGSEEDAHSQFTIHNSQFTIKNPQSPVPSPQSPALIGGIIAGLMAVLIGNLRQVGVLFTAWYQTGSDGLSGVLRTLDGMVRVLSGQGANIRTDNWFWTASRAINAAEGEVGPITEFPFFTFLYGDLHAHMISLPLTMLAVAWGAALVMSAARKVELAWWETAVIWLGGAIAIGSLQATNIWDLPTYLVIGAMAVTYAVFLRNGRSWSLPAVGQAGVLSVGLIALSLLAFYPFSDNFGAGFSSIGFWDGSHTYLANYLSIHGFFLFFAVSYLAIEFRAWAQTWSPRDLQNWQAVGALLLGVLFLYIVILLLLFAMTYWIVPVALTITIAAGLLGLRANLPAHRRIVLILLSSAIGLTVFVEFFIVEGTVQRMNTVFKVYMQVWMLLSVVGGVTAVWVWQRIQNAGMLKQAWQAVAVLLLAGVMLYPIQATAAKWNIRMSDQIPNTLDGMVFMEYVTYEEQNSNIPLNYDYDALLWMQENVEGSPVVAEMVSRNYYRSIGNRVAMFTGLPSIIGWTGHQDQQRAAVPGNKTQARLQDVEQLFNTTQINEALNIIERYDVQYIYAGQLEWVSYNPNGLNKFDQMVEQGYLEEAYRNEGTTIYRVN